MTSQFKLLYTYFITICFWRVLAFAIVAFSWFAGSWISGGVLPDPVQSFERILSSHSGYVNEGVPFWTHIAYTGGRAYLGLLIALMFSIPVAILVTTQKHVTYSILSLIEFARSVPAFMFLLVLICISVTQEWARMTCIVYSTSVIMIDYLVTAIAKTPAEYSEPYHLIGQRGVKLFFISKWMPLFLNAILPSLRIGVGVSLIVALVVETLIQPEKGMGMMINSYLGQGNLEGGLVLITVSGLLGWIGNIVITIMSDVSRWVFEGTPLAQTE